MQPRTRHLSSENQKTGKAELTDWPDFAGNGQLEFGAVLDGTAMASAITATETLTGSGGTTPGESNFALTMMS